LGSRILWNHDTFDFTECSSSPQIGESVRGEQIGWEHNFDRERSACYNHFSRSGEEGIVIIDIRYVP
jgi:hypothetical protein